jgi:hypothetical protein
MQLWTNEIQPTFRSTSSFSGLKNELLNSTGSLRLSVPPQLKWRTGGRSQRALRVSHNVRIASCHVEVGELGLFIRRVAGRRNSVISGRDKHACLRLSSRK